MDVDRRRVGHGARPYLRALGVASLLALCAWGARADAIVQPDGASHGLEIPSPGGKSTFRFEGVSGCRYRVTVKPGTLARPTFTLGPGSSVSVRVDPGSSGIDALHDFYAEGDGAITVVVAGFSAMTGRARLIVETLGPDGMRTAQNRRFLSEGGDRARVGELWIDEGNRWELAVEPGGTYEVATTPGTAGRVTLRAVGPGGTPVLGSTEGSTEPFPRLTFTVPPASAGPSPQPPAGPPNKPQAPAAPWFLEVHGVGGGGGTYGVRLRAVPPDASPRRVEAPDPVARGLLEDVPLGFRANPGDVAVLFLPKASPFDPHVIETRREGRWSPIPAEEISVYGERAAVRTPEESSLVAFRVHLPGEYRFLRGTATQPPVLRLYAAEQAGGGPLLLGSGVDRSIFARSTSAWRTLGVGLVMPGGDYLFVAAGSGPRNLSMRVRSLDGRDLARRTGGEFAATEVAGVGPSLRFRVREAQAVRLEVSGTGWRGYALLRRASN